MSQPESRPCVFCDIIARREPAHIRYEDDDVIVFDNLLQWVPVMLLVVPKKHLYQDEMWEKGTIAKVGAVAVEMGYTYCPRGFRLLSNFGRDALQTQAHGHIHVLGGTHLGPYA